MRTLVIITFSLALTACSGVGTGLAPSSPTQEQNAGRPTETTRAVSPRSLFGKSVVTHANHNPSWMAPNAKKDQLLYASDVSADAVNVYSLPSGAQVGTLTGLSEPAGECSDRYGNVYIANVLTEQILEYAHGGTSPINTWQEDNEEPYSCAIDPKTGNLAVSNLNSISGMATPNVTIYTSSAKIVATDSNFASMYFVGYDKNGNLYVDGQNSANQFCYAELPAGESGLVDIALQAPIQFPGGIQWDGKDMAVGDSFRPVIYRTLGATVVGTVTLSGVLLPGEFSFYGKGSQQKVVVPDEESGSGGEPNGTADIWRYPGGGNPVKYIGNLYLPLGSAVSI